MVPFSPLLHIIFRIRYQLRATKILMDINSFLQTVWVHVCMYIILTPRRIASVFEKVLSFYTHYTLSVPPYQPLSTGFGWTLEAGTTRASRGISIRRTAIVAVRTPYIWSYISVLFYRWDFGLGSRIRDMLPVFWSPHQGAGPFLWDLQF